MCLHRNHARYARGKHKHELRRAAALTERAKCLYDAQ